MIHINLMIRLISNITYLDFSGTSLAKGAKTSLDSLNGNHQK